MTALVVQWTGREIRALRLARRMSVRPRSENQAALDTSLATGGPEVRARFEKLAGGEVVQVEDVHLARGLRHVVRHPLDGKLMTLVEPGPYVEPGTDSVWLPGYYIDLLPTTFGHYAQFVAATGHRPPAQWPGGEFVESMKDTPVQVPWIDAQAYAQWAGKELPTVVQWQRAAGGEEGMVPGHLPEWCATPRGPRRHEPPTADRASGQPGFRCAMPAEQMLSLLAI
jgi:formylglycine-generating enzyme required for sulfatase activity